MITVAVASPEVPELLGRLRNKGWSDRSVALTLGVNRTTIWRWRIGTKVPYTGNAVAMALASLLDVEPPSSDN